ncbi:MAG: lysophospholipid acyltransferase family protein [Clostridia bacterium]|nr:lysophospholipid acyltransferase family protein [Clostridia bacterium]
MAPEDKNINDIKVRKPNAFLYYLIAFIVKVIAKLVFGIKYKKQGIKGLKGPFLVLGNHASVTDIAFTVGALLPHRLNIITSKDLFTWKAFKPFITRLGCIPKSQFAVDIMSLKTMKAAVEQGRNVAVYPEGKTSLDGKGLHYLSPSIGKLVKYLGVPVVLSYTLGSYLTKPRYFKGFRRGKVLMQESILFTAEEVKTLPVNELYDRIVNAIKFNDNIYQQENNIRFRTKKPAEGLEFILYRCPKCGLDYLMRSTDRRLICDYCGNSVEYNEYGKLIPDAQSKAFDRIDQWYDYQRKCVDEEIRKPDFFISKPVNAYIEENRDYKLVGEGELYIDKENIGYKGNKDGQPFALSTPLKTLHTVTTKNQEGIDLTYPDGAYRFLFKDQKGATKYGIIVEQMYRMIHNLDKK